MRERLIAILVSVTLLLLQGCGASPFPADSAPSDGGNDTITEVPVTAGTVFAVHVLTSPEEDADNFTLQKSCEISSSDPSGTTLNCTAEIPEGDLHFSNVKLQLRVVEGTSCNFVVFRPYYYQASTSATFEPSWTSAEVDCSVAKPPKDCFSGPATELISDFPTFRYYYVTPDGTSGLSTAWTFRSANEAGRYTGNRWTNNTLAPAARTGSLTVSNGLDGYIANSFVDYSFECRDKWFDNIYTIVLTIQDEDSGTPGCNINSATCNQWTNWNSTQATDPQ